MEAQGGGEGGGETAGGRQACKSYVRLLRLLKKETLKVLWAGSTDQRAEGVLPP
jgi:hypothetical protein